MNGDRRSRREFLEVTGAGLVGAAGAHLLGATAAEAHVLGDSAAGDGLGRTVAGARAMRGSVEDVDIVVFNAKVYTVDSRLPRAEAFAVRGGRFVAVGSSADIQALAGPRTQSIDAEQMTVVPGFIDTHNHGTGVDLLYSVLVGNPFVVEFVTIDSIIAKLRERARVTQPGEWVVGNFFDDTKVKDRRALSVHDLDQVSRDHPVVVRHRGGHTAFYNSKAFELAGVGRDTPNPAGGTFDRSENGDLNGRVTDRAMGAFRGVGSRQSFTDAEQSQRAREGMAFMSKKFVEYGITSVCHSNGDLRAMQEVRAAGDLLHRISYEVSGDMLDSMIDNGIMSGFGDEHIRLGSTSEHTIDGSFSERTMSLSMGYAGSDPPYHGNITTTQGDLDAWVERVHRAGIQVNCHANGDVAIDMMLTAVERALERYPRADTRPKITHCTLINDALLRRIKAVGAVPSMFTTYLYYNSDKFRFYGEELMQRSLAFRSMLDAGIHAAAGTDFRPGPFDPRTAIQGMVTRTGYDGTTWGINQAVSVDEALRINTLNGSYNTHQEAVKGSISAGKLADFVVLADDPHTVDVATIKDIGIVRTVVGGATVYEA